MKSIRELLTDREVISLSGETSALDAARAMTEHRVGALLITDADGAAAGIFTERDLMTRLLVKGLDAAKTPVSDLMTRDMFTASPNERVNQVAQEMQKRHIRHLPVVEGGQVVGLLSLRDLLREHLAIATGEVEALTAYIQSPAGEIEAAEEAS